MDSDNDSSKNKNKNKKKKKIVVNNSITFIGGGFLFAAGISYALWGSLWWAFLHGLLSWAYVAYVLAAKFLK